jgi:sugar/nucleoside kinase (ribokinase family)
LITATEKEARIATKNFSDGLVIISDNLKKTTNSKSVIIKLASEGILINSGKEFWKTDRIPALNNNPIDVAGAGDSFLSAISLSFTSGMNIWEASYVGSVASAIQINNLGNNPLSYEDLIKNI